MSVVGLDKVEFNVFISSIFYCSGAKLVDLYEYSKCLFKNLIAFFNVSQIFNVTRIWRISRIVYLTQKAQKSQK